MNMYPIHIALSGKDASQGRPCGAMPASCKTAKFHLQDHVADTVRPDKTTRLLHILIIPVHNSTSHTAANERRRGIQTP
jgi:hypothetical protein